MKRSIIAVLLLGVSACAPVQHTESLELSNATTSGLAGPGDLVARVNKQRNLQNAFGKSDIFGRKTDEGFIELRFAGMNPDGEVVLYRTDTNIVTNESTMSRTAGGGFLYGQSNGNQATLTGSSFTPASDYHAVIPAGSLQIAVPKGTDSIPFEGHVVHVLEATKTTLRFRVE
ncbi:MAG: hypothetical protein V4559_01485 [Pseudomonadota bacterium]